MNRAADLVSFPIGRETRQLVLAGPPHVGPVRKHQPTPLQRPDVVMSKAVSVSIALHPAAQLGEPQDLAFGQGADNQHGPLVGHPAEHLAAGAAAGEHVPAARHDRGGFHEVPIPQKGAVFPGEPGVAYGRRVGRDGNPAASAWCSPTAHRGRDDPARRLGRADVGECRGHGSASRRRHQAGMSP
jgi:hypothetical protein